MPYPIKYPVYGVKMTTAQAAKHYDISKIKLLMRMKHQRLSLQQAVEWGRRSPQEKTIPRKHSVYGIPMTVKQASIKYGIKLNTLYTRIIKHHMTLEQAIEKQKWKKWKKS